MGIDLESNFGWPSSYECDAICARAIVTVTNAAGKFAGLRDCGEIPGLDNDIVVAETMKLAKAGRHWRVVLFGLCEEFFEPSC